MTTAAVYDESRRLAALHALALLDAEPEQAFDALVSLAAEMLGCPTAMLNLVDRDRQWIMARTGIDMQETPRSIAFCDHTIRGTEAMVVPDATADARFAANPLVTGPLNVRFYAGVPICVADHEGDRQPIGALCVLDSTPRSLNDNGRRALTHLAALAEALLAARSASNEALAIATAFEQQTAALARADRVFRQAEQLAGIGSWRFSLDDSALTWSDNVYRIHGLPLGSSPPVDSALDHYPPDARARVAGALAATIETGAALDIEEDFITATAQHRRVRSRGELERHEGRPVAVIGVFQDVTEQHRLEAALRLSADTDALTGLANRAAFDRALAVALQQAHRDASPLLLVMIDLDGFKAINDTLGHLAGDDVLRSVAGALRAPWLNGSLAARLGGDEFALVIEAPALAGDPAGVAARLEQALCVGVTAGGIAMTVAGSVGLALLDDEGESARDLIHRADTALYAAKRARVGDRRSRERRRG